MAQPDLESGRPPLNAVPSAVGREAVFRDADTEVERILANAKNYYFVLKVTKTTPSSEIKQNYFRLSRLVHPDKCKHPRAADAAATVNQAYDTLTNAIKKMAYDAYVSDVDTNAPEGMSYAEWEARQAAHPVQLPAWLERFLRLPGAGIVVLLILFPLTLILIALLLVLWIICLPINIILTCCGCRPPPQGQGEAHPMNEEEQRAYAAAHRAGAAPGQQAAPAR